MSTLKLKPFFVDLKHDFHVDLLNFDLNNSAHKYICSYLSLAFLPENCILNLSFVKDQIYVNCLNKQTDVRKKLCLSKY